MKNVSSTSSFSLNEYYEKRSLLFNPFPHTAASRSESVIQAAAEKAKNTSRKGKKKQKMWKW